MFKANNENIKKMTLNKAVTRRYNNVKARVLNYGFSNITLKRRSYILDVRSNIIWRSLLFFYSEHILMFQTFSTAIRRLIHFRPMFHLYPPENVRKPKEGYEWNIRNRLSY